jgi:hypothetical protein
VDGAELARRIDVYLELDLPELKDRRRVAEALASRLFQYIRQPEPAAPNTSETLKALVPDGSVLVFTAPWDGDSRGYADVVRDAAEGSGRLVIEIDIEDPLGGAIARVLRVLYTPAFAERSAGGGLGPPVIGRRSAEELREIFTAST